MLSYTLNGLNSEDDNPIILYLQVKILVNKKRKNNKKNKIRAGVIYFFISRLEKPKCSFFPIMAM
jgi:hypothetical protein